MLELRESVDMLLVPDTEKGMCCLTCGEKEACSVEFGEIFRKKFLAKYEGG